MCAYGDSLELVTIPSLVVAIGSSAFYGCQRLGSVKLSASLDSVGENAFCACEKLTTERWTPFVKEIRSKYKE